LSWIEVCDLKSLSSGEIMEFNYEEKKILLVKIGDQIYASDRICTHADADLSLGILNEQEKTVTCPLHMSAFKLETGKPENLPAEIPLVIYQTKISNGSVFLLV
jgi:3-phenylpropionate/trans-cinnamate dioxygenase ferredoxin component